MKILNTTHIELTKIVKYKGEYYNAKMCMYAADIVRIEVDKRRDTDEPCTRIVLQDEYFIRVVERYSKVKELWLEWVKKTQENEKTEAN